MAHAQRNTVLWAEERKGRYERGDQDGSRVRQGPRWRLPPLVLEALRGWGPQWKNRDAPESDPPKRKNRKLIRK